MRVEKREELETSDECREQREEKRRVTREKSEDTRGAMREERMG